MRLCISANERACTTFFRRRVATSPLSSFCNSSTARFRYGSPRTSARSSSERRLPPAPVGLVATSTTAKAIHLTWREESNEESLRLFRRRGAGAWTLLATLDADTAAYTDDKAGGNNWASAYSYHLIACNNLNGELNSSCSPPSQTVVVPYLPTGLTATPGARQVSLQWTDVPNDTGYEIHRKPGTCAASGK